MVTDMIYITGDTHGEQTRFSDFKIFDGNQPSADDYLIVCGDFGYLFNDNEAEHRFLDLLETLKCTICFVDGNHENFPAIYRYPVVEWNGGRVHQLRKNILHLMRGEIFNICGKTFFTFGGAYSLDKHIRREFITWWKEERPVKAEYDNAAGNLERYNKRVDYILTHTMPREMIHKNGRIPHQNDMELTGFLEWVMHETDFKHWYCGHWHEDKDLTDKFTILWKETRVIE